LVSHAVRILEKYIDKTPGEYVFAVPSNQKLNDFIKEAAEMAGLDREVIDTSFCGTERIELVMKLHEAISCHCARRTFVCISLSLGIPQSVVMTMTGHADYETMRPYISISDETSKRELVKWEVGSTKSELTKLIDQMDQPQLEMMVSKAQELLMS
jgi:integrase